MPLTSLPNTIDANTTADAVEVEQNFDKLVAYIDTDLINRQGGVAMTGQLQLVGNPSSDRHAAPKEYVDALLPIGIMLPYCGSAAPSGQWAVCNGASLATASYPRLHSVLGFRYGGSGGTFNLPNMAGCVPLGVDASQTRFDATGKKGGSTLVPIPAHTHTIDHNHAQATSSNPSANHTHSVPAHAHTLGSHTHTFSDTSSSAGTHSHTGFVTNDRAPGSSSRLNISGGTGSATITNDGGAHTHAISGTTSAASGNTGNSAALTSGTVSAWHTHTVDLPAFAGPSGSTKLEVQIDSDPATVSSTEHIAPYVVVAYIIRVDQQ